MPATLLQNGTIVTALEEKKADVLIENNRIVSIEKSVPVPEGAKVIDATGLLILPGLIDCHVHFREPGLTHKATMKSEATSALAGGVTTVCEMPNTLPPTVTVAALADKVRRAEACQAELGRAFDMRFFFGVTEAQHLQALEELWTSSSEEMQRLRARCCGIKLYLDHSTGNQKVDARQLPKVFSACAKLGIQIVAHCEDAAMNAVSQNLYMGSQTIADHSRARPPESEAKSITDAIALARESGAKLHIAHLSTKQGIKLVRSAKKEGLHITCEVAPHHLFLTVDDYAALGTLAKMNPPLRTKDHQDALWAGIMDGTVDCISTDHAPHTLEEKRAANPLGAPSGVPGVETMVPLLLTVASGNWPGPKEDRAFRVQDIVRLCFENPNRIFTLGKRGIVEGAEADLVVIDPKAQWTIRGKELHSMCKWTPYENWVVTGKIRRNVS